MNDWGKSVLDQYELNIEDVRRGRGALICETDQGLKLLQACGCTERHLEAENALLLQVRENGFPWVDVCVRNKEGKLFCEDAEHRTYVLKDWFEGAECSAERQEDWRRAADALARLHQTLQKCQIPQEDRNTIFAGESIREEYRRHNRELLRVRNYIHGRKQKSLFERLISGSFSDMYQQALYAEEELGRSAYDVQYQEALDRGILCHGSFHYHNVLLTPQYCAVTNFRKASVQVQMEDLYLFMRKILEKRGWKEDIGESLLNAYSARNPLSEGQLQILYCLFAYPEKYWKQLNFYLNSKKAWIPEKNTEKLLQCIHQEQARRQFMERVLK